VDSRSPKYGSDATRFVVPAPLDPELAMRLRRTAIDVFEVLGCAGLARVDFFVPCAGEPVVNEINDGHDTVQWITRQDWCNGKVGMWGESYYGLTSLAAAMSGVPGLTCIAPGEIVMDWHKIWFRQGANP